MANRHTAYGSGVYVMCAKQCLAAVKSKLHFCPIFNILSGLCYLHTQAFNKTRQAAYFTRQFKTPEIITKLFW